MGSNNELTPFSELVDSDDKITLIRYKDVYLCYYSLYCFETLFKWLLKLSSYTTSKELLKNITVTINFFYRRNFVKFYFTLEEFAQQVKDTLKNSLKQSNSQDVTITLKSLNGDTYYWTFTTPSNVEQIEKFIDTDFFKEDHYFCGLFLSSLQSICNCHRSRTRILESIICGYWIPIRLKISNKISNLYVCLPRTCNLHQISAVTVFDWKRKFIYNIFNTMPHYTVDSLIIDPSRFSVHVYFDVLTEVLAEKFNIVPKNALSLQDIVLKELIYYQTENFLLSDLDNPLLERKQTNTLIPFLKALKPQYHTKNINCKCTYTAYPENLLYV